MIFNSIVCWEGRGESDFLVLLGAWLHLFAKAESNRGPGWWAESKVSKPWRFPKISLPPIGLQMHHYLSEERAICCSVSLENPSKTPPSAFASLPLLSTSALLCTDGVSWKREFPNDVSAGLLQGIPELKNQLWKKASLSRGRKPLALRNY